MPSDTMPVLLSTGVSFGLVAGIVSGVCYLLANGIGWHRGDRQLTAGPAEFCSECGDADHKCPYCRNTTPTPEERNAIFDEGRWLLSQLHKGLSFMPWSISTEDLRANRDAATEASCTAAARARRETRDFLEQLAARLVSGSLDDTSVSRMYDHPLYERMFLRHREPLRNALAALALAVHDALTNLPSRRDGSSAGVSEGASGAHARLKRLVARAAEEAATLPALRHRASIAPPSKDFRADTYEDLLATAILNKVIDAYQQQECGSSGVHSASDSAGSARAPTAGRSRSPSSHEPFSHDDGSQSDSSGAPRSDSGVRRGRPERGDRTLFRQYSSEEERLAHQPRAAAAHSTRHDNPVDDALANIDFSQSIIPFPEFGRDIIDVQENDICFGEESGYEKDNIGNGDIHAVTNTWEENWLFQKRRIKTPQAVPVPMLVPNSTADFRALIGDRDAEDTTDLSELGSDSDDDISITTDLKQVLVTSKTLIGGKNGRNINSRNVDISVDKDELDSSAVVSNMFNGGNESIECGVIPFYKSFNGEEEFQNSIEDSKQKFAVEEYGKVFINVNSGPLTKTEFNVSEIHRVSNEMDDTNSLIDDEDNHVINGNGYEVENLNGTIAATDEFDIEMKSLDTSWPEYKKDVTEATNFDVLDAKENDHALSSLNHQKESEYTETIAMPVQRHDDSLRRDYHARACELTASPPVTTPPTAAPRSRSSGIQCETKYSEEEDLSIIPGSIADRERKKWLNSVPMPNNPYSAEAIEKRLSSNSTSAIFDILTSGKDIERNVKSKDQNDNHIRESKASTKILKDVLAEEVPQYKRYGRDYYINEAKKSTGARKRNGDLEAERSLSTSNRSQSLEQFNADDNTSSTIPVTSSTRKDDLSIDQMNEKSKDIDSHLDDNINIANTIPELVTLMCKTFDEDDIFLAEPVIIEDEADKCIQQFASSNMDVTGDILQPPSDTNIEDLQREVDAMIELDISETNDLKHKDISSSSELNIDSYEYSASSLDDSVKVYNVKTGEIISQKYDYGLAPTEISSVDNKILSNDMIDNSSDNVLAESVKSGDDHLATEEEQKHTNVIEKEIMNIENENYDDFKMPKVKDLAKKFFNNEKKESIKIQPTPARRKMSSDYELEVVNKNPISKPRDPMHMHSLTARSISKEFREELKMSMPTITKLPGGANQLPEGTEDAFREEKSVSPVPEPGTLKNKLAFFESLKSKN